MPQCDEDLRLARAQTSLLKKKSSPLPRASSPSSTSLFGQDPAVRHFESVTSSWGSEKGRSPYVTSDKTSRVYEITASATWGGSILGETNIATTSNQHRDNVVTVLNFGGCESVESTSVTSSYVMCGNVSNVGSGEGVSIYSETFEEEASAALSTPPRIARPSRHVTLSPTTHASITPVISKPPTMARVAPSPTRDRQDSEFGKVLGKAAGGNHLVSPSHTDHKATDEWKEAVTPEGKHYFYNRRTRESVWRAPSDGIIVPLSNQNQQEQLQEDKKKEQEQEQVTSPEETKQLAHNLRNKAKLNRAREQFELLVDRCLTHDENSLNRFFDFCSSELTLVQHTEGETEQCPECGRVFSRGRLQKHRVGCATIRETRQPSDSARKRIVGTPMEFSFVAKSKVVTPHRDTLRPKTSPSLSRAPL